LIRRITGEEKTESMGIRNNLKISVFPEFDQDSHSTKFQLSEYPPTGHNGIK
jgi:hypothetical protein